MSEQDVRALYWAQVPSKARAEDLLNSILELEKADAFTAIHPLRDPSAAFARDRIISIARALLQRFGALEPALTSEHGMTQIAAALQSIFNEAQAYASNLNVGHLNNARAAVDNQLFPALNGIFPSGDALPLDAAQIEAIREIRVAAAREIAKVRDEAVDALGKIHKPLTSLRERITELETKLDGTESDFARVQSEMRAALARLEQSFAENERDRADKFAGLLELSRAQYEERSQLAEAEAQSLLEKLRAHEQEIARLANAMGTKGITATYSAIANSEIGAANRWRNATVAMFGLGLLVALVVFCMFVRAGFSNINLVEIGIRFGFALVVTSPAIYFARESARHRTIGDRARQAEMELTSLGPFIANLDSESQEAIRARLVDKYFGRPLEPHTSESPVKFKDVSNLAVELVKASRDTAEKKK